MKTNHLQFRFWCPAGKAFIRDYKYSGMVDELFDEKENDILIPQQCTGLKDKNGDWVYEGDVVEFTKETRVYKGIVERDPRIPCNMDIIVESEIILKPIQIFSLQILKEAVIIGHIFKKS